MRMDHALAGHMDKTIELDCAPGDPRPGDFIGEVVRGTALEHLPEAAPDATTSRVFGCWMWSFPNVPDNDWIEIQKTTKARILTLYNSKRVRYGSW